MSNLRDGATCLLSLPLCSTIEHAILQLQIELNIQEICKIPVLKYGKKEKTLKTREKKSS